MLLYTPGVRYAAKIRNKNYEIFKGNEFSWIQREFFLRSKNSLPLLITFE